MTPDELSRLSSPPRPVPLSTYLRVIFGGVLPQMGWLFFGFGMIFVWPFGGNDLAVALVHFSGPLEYTNGEVTCVRVLVDDLPGSLHVASDGNLEGSMASGIVVAVLPGLVCLGHGLWLLSVLS